MFSVIFRFSTVYSYTTQIRFCWTFDLIDKSRRPAFVAVAFCQFSLNNFLLHGRIIHEFDIKMLKRRVVVQSTRPLGYLVPINIDAFSL